MSDERATEIDAETRRRLESVSTATLAAVLQKRGVRSTFLSGLAPIRPGQQWSGGPGRCASSRFGRT